MTINSGYCGSLCNNSAGGVQRFYIVNTVDIDKTSINRNDDGELTEMTINGDMYPYVPYVDSSSWSDTLTVAPENGTLYYEQTANIIMGANNQELRNIVDRMGKASNMVVLVLDNNGKLWLIGDPYGKRRTWLSSGNSNSGVGYGDRNGWELTVMCRNSEPAFQVKPAENSDLAASIADADAFCDGGSGTGL